MNRKSNTLKEKAASYSLYTVYSIQLTTSYKTNKMKYIEWDIKRDFLILAVKKLF